MTVFTIGHGNRTTDELASLLRGVDVGLLVDIRRYPASRRNPHLARSELAAALQPLGVDYLWHGEGLGGRRRSNERSRHPAWRVAAFRAYADYMDTPPFRDALETLKAAARSGPPLALMCAETLWWRCHRRLVSDALVVDGFEIVHLLGPDKSQAHVLHPSLRLDEDGRPVYDNSPRASSFDESPETSADGE